MIWLFVSFLVWAFVHSITAAAVTKNAFRARFGERFYQGWYRLLYNIVSAISILPILIILWLLVPQVTLWSIPYPWRYLTMIIQGMALIGLAVSLLQTDVWSFVGVRQVVRYFNGAEEPKVPEQFVSTGTYRLVRHPLYFFSLVFIWLNPEMSLGSFLFNSLAALYFWIGSIYEERRLLAAFGDAYEEYRQMVPRLLPTRLLGRGLV